MNAVIKLIEEVVIRQADYADIERLVEFAEQFWSMTEFSNEVAYDLETMINTTADLIDNDVVLYAESGGQVVGFLAVMISPFPMNKHVLSACEWGFFVDMEYRKTGVGIQLLERAEEMLREKGVKFFTMIALDNLRPEIVGRFYQRLGFKRTEIDYMKVLGV
jgi:GNAT superfamily N-acetyltransferase